MGTVLSEPGYFSRKNQATRKISEIKNVILKEVIVFF